MGDGGLISVNRSSPALESMSAWDLPLGDGVCPDLIPPGGGERDEYPDVPIMGLTGTGLPRGSTAGGLGVGSGGGAAATLRPPWRIACLLFWNLRKQFTNQKSQMRCRQGHVPTKFGHFELTCPRPSPKARVLVWTGTPCDYR